MTKLIRLANLLAINDKKEALSLLIEILYNEYDSLNKREKYNTCDNFHKAMAALRAAIAHN